MAKSFYDYDDIVLKTMEERKEPYAHGGNGRIIYNQYYHYMVANNVATIYVIWENGWACSRYCIKMFKDKKSACSFIGLTEKEYEEYIELAKKTHFGNLRDFYYHEIKEITLKEVVEQKLKYEREDVKAEITLEIKNEIAKNEREAIIKEQKHKDWLIIKEKLKNFKEDLKETIYKDEWD